MFNISSFLEKFSKNISNIESNKTKILEIIKKHTNLNLLPKEIEIKNYIVYIKSSPIIKNKIFIYKNKILEEVSILLIKITDIR